MVKIHANSESEEAARKEVEMIEQLPRNPHPLLPRPLAMTTESMAASAALLARLTNVSRPPFPFPPPFLTKSPGPFPFPTSAGFPPSLHPPLSPSSVYPKVFARQLLRWNLDLISLVVRYPELSRHGDTR